MRCRRVTGRQCVAHSNSTNAPDEVEIAVASKRHVPPAMHPLSPFLADAAFIASAMRYQPKLVRS